MSSEKTVEQRVKSTIQNAINNLALDEKELGIELTKMHPSLQQTFMRIAMHFIEEKSKATYSDARNEATVKLAKRIIDLTTENERFLPMA